MEQQRVSAPPSAPAATVQRSKASSQARAAEGAADDPAMAGGFSSLLSALGDGVTEDILQPPTTLLASATPLLPHAAPPIAYAGQLPDVGPLSHAAQLSGVPLRSNGPALPGAAPLSQAAPRSSGLVPAVPAKGSGATLQAWQRVDAWRPLSGGAAQGSGVVTLSLADAAQRAGLLGAELLGQGGLVAQTAKIDAAVELPVAQGQGNAVAGYQRAFARLQNVLSQGAQVGAGLAAQALGHQSAGAYRQGALASQAQSPAWASVPEAQASAAAASPHAPTDVAAPALLAQWLAAEPAARSVAAPVATEYRLEANALSGPAYGAQGETRLDGAPTASDSTAAGTGDAVTEQASYWVSENLQNAELTVTHDGLPVEVSVSLSGKEAHVAFRSDESQTRDLLDSSQDQLRDMLGNEGLVLSGVSVGESGARHASGEGAASPRGRTSGRVGVQVPVSEGATDASRRPHVVTDSAVDVFV